jgi:hypothetical protein
VARGPAALISQVQEKSRLPSAYFDQPAFN